MNKKMLVMCIIAVVVVLFSKGVFAHEPEATEGFTVQHVETTKI